MATPPEANGEATRRKETHEEATAHSHQRKTPRRFSLRPQLARLAAVEGHRHPHKVGPLTAPRFHSELPDRLTERRALPLKASCENR